MIKRLRMAWCVLRGGHFPKITRRMWTTGDVLIDCIRCRWTLLIVGHCPIEAPSGRNITFYFIDEAP